MTKKVILYCFSILALTAVLAQSPGVTIVNVSFSATPTFTTTALSTNFVLTLTGNVTSSSFSSAAIGIGTMNICQDSTGGRSFVWPANFIGFPKVNTAASACIRADWVYDGTNVRYFAPHSFDIWPTTWTPEEFGAKRDGSTDDSGPIQACVTATKLVGGTCKLAAGTYIMNTMPIDMSSTSPFGARLIGSGMWNTNIVTTDTTNNLVNIHGTGAACTTGLVLNTRVADFLIQRTAMASTGNGIDIQNGCWTEVDHINSANSIAGFYLKGTADAAIMHSQAGWVTTSTPHSCIEIDSTGGAVNPSNYVDHLACAEGAGGTNGRGLYLHGGSINDFQMIYLNTNAVATCMDISSTSNNPGTGINNGDIHILHPICDLGNVAITNVYGDGQPTVEIGSGHFAGPGGSAITLTNTSGVNIHDSQIVSAGGSGVGVTVTGANSFANHIHNNTIQVTQLDCILVNGSASDNQFNDNSCGGVSGTAVGTGINFASGAGPNNQAIGNTFYGFITTALNIASGVVGTVAFPNTYNGTNITTKIVDAGSASYVGILPLTLANAPASPETGHQFFCTNCTTAATCAITGSGHMAVWNGSAWTCQ